MRTYHQCSSVWRKAMAQQCGGVQLGLDVDFMIATSSSSSGRSGSPLHPPPLLRLTGVVRHHSSQVSHGAGGYHSRHGYEGGLHNFSTPPRDIPAVLKDHSKSHKKSSIPPPLIPSGSIGTPPPTPGSSFPSTSPPGGAGGGAGSTSNTTRDLLLSEVCPHFMNQRCHYVGSCRWVHDPLLCREWWRTGGKYCPGGKTCVKNHFVTIPSGGLHRDGGGREGGQSSRSRSFPHHQRDHQELPPRSGSTRPRAVYETATGGVHGKRHGYGARNTDSFAPSHEPPTMRIVVDAAVDKISVPVQVRDVTLHPCVFKQPGDEAIYSKIISEIKHCSVPQEDLIKSWHGDTHWIANDRTKWKEESPTFHLVLERLRTYFAMDIQATRFNWYKDQSEWKPYHHDAAAVKPDKARTQNFTVGVSFGCTRDAAFEEVESKKTIAIPQPDGMVYTFARDVNVMWKHGILQVPPKQQKEEGRISIIAWGWVDLDEVN